MKAAVVGDNCIDYYERLGRLYPTGNCVDMGVNLEELGISTSIISKMGSDEYGQMMLQA